MKKAMKVTPDNLHIVVGRLKNLLQKCNSVRTQNFYTRSYNVANRLYVLSNGNSLVKNGKVLVSQPYNSLQLKREVKIRPNYKRTLGDSFFSQRQFWTEDTLLLIGDSLINFFCINNEDTILFRGNRVIIETERPIVDGSKCIQMINFN